MLDIAAIRVRCDAATPGPWEPGRQSPYTLRFPIHQAAGARKVNLLGWQRACICREARMNDATFIAAARADVPALCDEVERLRAELAKAQGVIPCYDCGEPATTSMLVSSDGYKTLRQAPFCLVCAAKRTRRPDEESQP